MLRINLVNKASFESKKMNLLLINMLDAGLRIRQKNC